MLQVEKEEVKSHPQNPLVLPSNAEQESVLPQSEEQESPTDLEIQRRIKELLGAAGRGDADAVREILRQGVNIDAYDRSGLTALHWAAGNGHEKVVELLLDEGADVDARDQDSSTALHGAARAGYLEVVKVLLKKVKHVNATKEFGSTALHVAAEENHGEIVRELLAHGANPSLLDVDKRMAIFYADLEVRKIIEQFEQARLMAVVPVVAKAVMGASVISEQKSELKELKEYSLKTEWRQTVLEKTMCQYAEYTGMSAKIIEVFKKPGSCVGIASLISACLVHPDTEFSQTMLRGHKKLLAIEQGQKLAADPDVSAYVTAVAERQEAQLDYVGQPIGIGEFDAIGYQKICQGMEIGDCYSFGSEYCGGGKETHAFSVVRLNEQEYCLIDSGDKNPEKDNIIHESDPARVGQRVADILQKFGSEITCIHYKSAYPSQETPEKIRSKITEVMAHAKRIPGDRQQKVKGEVSRICGKLNVAEQNKEIFLAAVARPAVSPSAPKSESPSPAALVVILRSREGGINLGKCGVEIFESHAQNSADKSSNPSDAKGEEWPSIDPDSSAKEAEAQASDGGVKPISGFVLS